MPAPKRKRLYLAECDLQNLRESGLRDSTIEANGLQTKNGNLEFPIRLLDGTLNGDVIRRPHNPSKSKYLNPTGKPNQAYLPFECLADLRKHGTQTVVTEGPKKAMALAQEGYTTVGAVGIYGWNKPGDTEQLNESFLQIDWTGRDVYIVFDWDSKPLTRANVAKAAAQLAKALRKAGARQVYWVSLPPGPSGTKQGVDDYLVANGIEAFGKLMENAQPIVGNNVINLINSATAHEANAGPINAIKIINPPVLGEAALFGLAGKFIREVTKYTEATEPAVLAHFLPAVGTLIGPGPHVFAGSRQCARLNVGIVGPTSRGRKGTSAVPTELLMEKVDDVFWNKQRASGLSSGEGLIAKVADKLTRNEDGEYEVEEVEKRLCVIEPEFSRVLANIRREGNVLSQVMREAFDSGNLSTLTVTPREATGAHISIVAHITPEELAARLSQIEMANGFGNRFAWFYSLSNKFIPHTKPFPERLFLPFAEKMRMLLMKGASKKRVPIGYDTTAANRWEEVYERLTRDQPGLAGAMVARGAPIVHRLALIYCLLDRGVKNDLTLEWDPQTKIAIDHLEAALAVWDYCEESAYLLFGRTGGNLVADKILSLLANQPLTRTELIRHFSEQQKQQVPALLESLECEGRIRKAVVKKPSGAGRPAERWELATA